MPVSLSAATVRIWGYARASTNRQEKSPDMQEDLILQRYARGDIPGPFAETAKEHESAVEWRWDERPQFKALMAKMQPGDHLIIWRLDRLDRNPFAMIRAVEWLANRGIVLHILEFGGMELDLSTFLARAFVMMAAIFADFFVTQQKAAIKAGFAFCKENGLPVNQEVPFGMRVEKRAKRKYFVWDADECRQMQEIYRRFQAGESVPEIGLSFFQRRERRTSGKPWVIAYGRRKRLDYGKLHRVVRWMRQLEAEGHTLAGPDCPIYSEAKLKAFPCQGRARPDAVAIGPPGEPPLP